MSGTGAIDAQPTITRDAHGDGHLAVLLRLSALDLRPLPTAVPSARLHARNVLLAWRLDHWAEDGELVVSELVTNAVQAAVLTAAGAEPKPVRLRLSARTDGREACGVQIEVWDASDEELQRDHDRARTEPGGWGLLLVEATSSRWGFYPTKGAGKVVWAVVGR
jgi:anti-sigma regulatory factor (Ser/Thr protein kinase)